jgi:hypothetical protein
LKEEGRRKFEGGSLKEERGSLKFEREEESLAGAWRFRSSFARTI